jgi:F-type H+-transporting ATPase subunit gamma
MAGGREVKTKIKSVQNTRKVTRALEMVSASKIRKAQERMKASRPYASLMTQLIGHIAKANSEYTHPFMADHGQIKRIGYIIISTDRGLCGGLNSGMFRSILVDMREWQAKGAEIDVVCVGSKAATFFRRLKVQMIGSVTHLGDKPRVDQLIGVSKVMLDSYAAGTLDRVFICYNHFINTMSQQARIHQLLPLPPSESLQSRFDWDYIYEPSPEVVLDHVMTRYAESLVYQAVVENIASEHAARMVAMKSASDNANKLIETLQLIYNKARQAAITQEISEIVGGAAAV